MSNIPPAYPQYSQPAPPPPPYPQYMPQYPPPPPPPPYNAPYPPKPQRQVRMKAYYRNPPKQSNTIFIKNIPYDLSNEEFKSIYSKFGEIAKIIDHIKNRGIAFITYYSILSAIDAVEQMKNVKIHDRYPDTLFSYKPPEYSRIDPKSTSTLVEVQPIQPTNQILPQDQVSEAMSKFGQIYQVHEIEPNHIIVQFCDMRFAQHAAESAASIDIGGIKCKVELYVEPAGDAIIQPVMPPQYNSRIPPGPPPSQMPMPPQMPPSYQQMPPSYQHRPQQMPQMPMGPPPQSQYPPQVQMPQYGAPPQQMQSYQYGSIPPQMTSPPPPPSAPPQNPSQPANSPQYPNYSSNHPQQQDLASSLLNSVLK